MIKITAKVEDGGVMLEAKLDGNGEDIARELAAIVTQVPLQLLEENESVFDEFKYHLEIAYAASEIARHEAMLEREVS